jgi:hypothetical protein
MTRSEADGRSARRRDGRSVRSRSGRRLHRSRPPKPKRASRTPPDTMCPSAPPNAGRLAVFDARARLSERGPPWTMRPGLASDVGGGNRCPARSTREPSAPIAAGRREGAAGGPLLANLAGCAGRLAPSTAESITQARLEPTRLRRFRARRRPIGRATMAAADRRDAPASRS